MQGCWNDGMRKSKDDLLVVCPLAIPSEMVTRG